MLCRDEPGKYSRWELVTRNKDLVARRPGQGVGQELQTIRRAIPKDDFARRCTDQPSEGFAEPPGNVDEAVVTDPVRRLFVVDRSTGRFGGCHRQRTLVGGVQPDSSIKIAEGARIRTSTDPRRRPGSTHSTCQRTATRDRIESSRIAGSRAVEARRRGGQPPPCPLPRAR